MAGRRAGGGNAAVDKDLTVGLSDDDMVDNKKKSNVNGKAKKKESDSDEDIDLPGI